MIDIRRDTDSILGKWWWKIDRRVLVLVFSIMLFGILSVFSVHIPVSEKFGTSRYYFVLRHFLFLAISYGLIILFSFFNERFIRRISVISFLLFLLITFAAIFNGHTVNGSKRWLKISNISLQPSEFLKVFFIISNAWILSITEMKNLVRYTASFSMLLVSISLLIVQPDVGMSLLFSVIWFTQIFISGVSWRIVVVIALIILTSFVSSYFIFDHVHNRIHSFLFHEKGKDGYQVEMAISAMNNGGIFGVGPGEGTIKFHIPDAHTDFIFAVIAEEFGIFACLLIVLLFFLLIRIMIGNIMKLQNLFSVIAVCGMVIELSTQVFINIGAEMRLIPAKGMTLPFISYGGSSAISSGIMVGIMLSLSSKRFENNLKIY